MVETEKIFQGSARNRPHRKKKPVYVENTLLKEHLKPLKLGTAARRLGIDRLYLYEITEGYVSMSARVALALEQHFTGRTAEEWLLMGRKPEKKLEQLKALRTQQAEAKEETQSAETTAQRPIPRNRGKHYTKA